MNVSNHCVTNSAKDLPNIDNLIMQRIQGPCTLKTSKSNKNDVIRDEKAAVKDKV